MVDVNWIVPPASIFAAVLVAIANAWVQRWRHKVDRLSASVELFCTEINAAADLATEYWLTAPAHQLRDTSAPLRPFEARLVGRQSRLQELANALADQDQRFPIIPINEALPDFFEALTGGQFQVEGRAADPEHAQLVQSLAAKLNGELRRALGLRLRQWR